MNKNGKGEIDRWYLFINLLSYVLPIVFLVLIPWYLFYRPIEVTREPWQVLDPGKAVDNPLKFEIVQEGGGPVVEAGDLVQLSLWWRSASGKDKHFGDDWWIWVGFRTEKETPFHSIDTRLASAFIGLKEGGGKISGVATQEHLRREGIRQSIWKLQLLLFEKR
ncbi:hypothetical protein FACS189475_05690 [Betaproteobacteria bacterium]|nr:hypothetical protein FACS189475_05690 [Betaproteobacteria bacterium]